MPDPMHRDDARKAVIGVVTFLLLAAVGVIGAIVQTGGALPARSYTYVNAEFDDVGVLKPGKAVKRNGIHAGTVSAIEYRGGSALVTLRLDGAQKVFRDARAEVGNTSALGRKFVTFDPGTPQAGLLGGTTIPRSQTKSSVVLEDMFDALDPKTRKALASSLAELGGGVAGSGPDLNRALRAAPDMLGDVERLSAAATDPRADLGGMLTSANELVGRFAGREAQLSALVRNFDTTLRAMNVDDAVPLRKVVGELPPTLQEARRALDDLNRPLRDVKSAVRDLEPGGAALGASADDLRGVLREAVGPLRKIPPVGRQAVPAVDHLTRTLHDARPLVPRLSHLLAGADTLLHGLAPYATDASRFFSQHDLLSGTIAPGKHYFAAKMALPGLYTASGPPDPVTGSEPYPNPGGGAWDDSSTGGNP